MAQTGTADVESGCSGLISSLRATEITMLGIWAAWTCGIVSVILTDETRQDSLQPQ